MNYTFFRNMLSIVLTDRKYTVYNKSLLQLQYNLFLILTVCVLTLYSVCNVFHFPMFTVQDFYLTSLLSVWLCASSLIKTYNSNITMKFYLFLWVLCFTVCYMDGNSSRPYSVTTESRTAVDNLLAFGLGPKCTPFKVDLWMQLLCFVRSIRKKYYHLIQWQKMRVLGFLLP